MKAWITKYALTRGIYQVEGDENESESHFSVEGEYGLFFKGQYHPSESEAIEDANKRRRMKITSLGNQMKKSSEN